MMNEQTFYTIQEASQATGLPGSTLRCYEEIGLLDPVERGANGHRRYCEADMRRLYLIIRLRITGMSLEAISEFVALYRGGARTAQQRRQILEAHRREVVAKVEELQAMLSFIDFKIDLYRQEEVSCEQQYDAIPAAG